MSKPIFTRRFKTNAVLCCVLSFISMSAFASNVSFLNDSAISFFRGNDKMLMLNNITKALDDIPDGRRLNWKNPSTGSWGYAIPSHTANAEGTICRDLTIFNSANHVTGQTTYRFCKVSGAWKIVQ